MNKTAIKNFAIWARNKLIADIQYKAGLMGITPEGIKDPLPQSTVETQFFDIGTAEPYAITGEAIKQRTSLVNNINQKAKETDLVGNMVSEGTTPRQLTDLLGSLCDLTSGSGDKGTPVVFIQGYFDNYADE